MKKTMVSLALISLLNVALVEQSYAQNISNSIINLSQDKVAKGLKEALENGIDKQVVKLTQKDGFFKNDLVKILLPKEVQKVDQTLRKMGMDNIADQGLLVLNRAAEEAVKEATPIFIDAVKNISFNDAKNILLGNEQAATDYLQQATSKSLYNKFSPVIQNSLENVGADQIWNTIFTNYNSLPLVTPVNTDITNYVTEQTMAGVFKMIAVEERNIRSNMGDSRSTSLLKDVFGSQDKTKSNTSATPKSNSKSKEATKTQNEDELTKKARGLFKKIFDK